jgi:uncharacterized iron-regulated protein
MTKPFGLLAGCLLVLTVPAAAQDVDLLPEEVPPKPDFRVYSREGAPSSLEEILAATDGADVLLVGEEHDDMVGHRIEEILLAAVIDRRMSLGPDDGGVVLSLEMFERDVQYVLDEYLLGLISEDHFLRSSRPWDDYEARYRGLVELSKERGVGIVAANAPRRYVNRVTREGPESLVDLTDFARSYLPPLPYPGPSDLYRAQWGALMAEAQAAMREQSDTVDVDELEAEAASDAASRAGEPTAQEAPVEEQEHREPGNDERRGYEGNPNALWAQALWDAAMGHAITRTLEDRGDRLVVHMAGSFHVERGTGILERIGDYRPGTRVVTVVMTKARDVDDWRDETHSHLADFVVLTQRPAAKESPGS